MIKIIHPIAGVVAVLTILSFWISTLLSEVFGTAEVVTMVKTLVPWGFLILIPALMTVGISGFRMGRKWRGVLIEKKRQRMPFIALNGILILVPSALYLAFKAQNGEFDTGFYLVQAVELVAGAVNITLLGMSLRDGLRLTGKLRRSPARSG